MWDSRQLVTMWAEEDTVEVRYQATTGEDTEDLVRAVVRIRVHELAAAL
jgi:hypothetical protein